MITIITTASPSSVEMEIFFRAVNDFRVSRGLEVELIIVDDLRLLSRNVSFPDWLSSLHIKVIRPSARGQLGAGIQALGHASGSSIITIDPDMYRNLDDIDLFLSRQASGSDLVYGARVSRNDVSPARIRLSRAFNFCTRTLFRVPVRDINTPMLLVSSNIVPDILRYNGSSGLAKVYFPYILGARFSEVEIDVVSAPKKSAYSYRSLLFFMFSQVAGLFRFLRFRLGMT